MAMEVFAHAMSCLSLGRKWRTQSATMRYGHHISDNIPKRLKPCESEISAKVLGTRQSGCRLARAGEGGYRLA